MSPIAVNFFRHVPTSIELNGPILSFTQHPVSAASTETGSVTFTGIATASFPSQNPPNLVLNAGELVYQWYEVGIGSIVGANTNALTLSNVSNSSDNGRQFYLESTYISSGINSISSTRQRFTGNAVNEPLNSNIASLQVYPNIVINKQLSTSTAAVDNVANFTIDASLSDGTTTGLNYQWRLNGQNLRDGSSVSVETISTNLGDLVQGGYYGGSYIDPSDGISYAIIVSPRSSGELGYTDPTTPNGTTGPQWKLTLSGPDGSGTDNIYYGSLATETLGDNSQYPVFSWAKALEINGYTDWYVPSIEELKIIYNNLSPRGIDTPSVFKVGGGEDFTESRYFWSSNESTVANFYAIAFRFTTGIIDDTYPKSSINPAFARAIRRVPLTSVNSQVVTETRISGSTTPNLSITLPSTGLNSISCVVSNALAGNSPLVSDSVNYNLVGPRSILKLEQYGSSSTAVLSEYDLDDSGFSLTPSDLTNDTLCLYASEKDIDIEMDVYAGPGISYAGNSGGQGGYSKIRFAMQKGEEYIITGLKSNNAIFLYRKSNLIASVGQGGNAGTQPGSNGGNGAGANLIGGLGTGPAAGSGSSGDRLGPLEINGIFGSAYQGTIYREDSKVDDYVYGGKTIICTKGVYWRNQGKSPCSDLGTIKFRLSDGTEVTNSASIDRGFKAGYSITATAGQPYDADTIIRTTTPYAGNGGNGAWGGNASSNSRAGGGGGSGYADDSIDVVESTVGGGTLARINVRISDGDFYIDSQGRILILSNTDNRDPRTLTKVTGKVLSGTNTCIDDARWQKFIDLARTTDGYRLTATLDRDTTRIVNATSNNIRRMINANALPLRNSLTDWYDSNYAYTLLALAWDEDSGGISGFGGDYSILSWSPTGNYGHGYYGLSSNSFFTPTTYNNFSANWWILPPGVPDF